MILVSACLLGIHAKYDGTTNNTNNLLLKYSNRGMYLPICPEQLGGLATPRLPAEIINGTGADVLRKKAKIKNKIGEDVTKQFIKGAEQVLYISKTIPITAAILKEGSPSCGSLRIYDGTFQNVTQEGQGVTAATLRQNSIPVYSDEEITEELLRELLDL